MSTAPKLESHAPTQPEALPEDQLEAQPYASQATGSTTQPTTQPSDPFFSPPPSPKSSSKMPATMDTTPPGGEAGGKYPKEKKDRRPYAKSNKPIFMTPPDITDEQRDSMVKQLKEARPGDVFAITWHLISGKLSGRREMKKTFEENKKEYYFMMVDLNAGTIKNVNIRGLREVEWLRFE
jgi:hypothetical protein